MRKVSFSLGCIQLDLVPGLHVVPQRKTLCDKDGLAGGKMAQNLPGVSAGEADHFQIEKDLSVHGSNLGRLALIFHLQDPEGIQGLYSGKRG